MKLYYCTGFNRVRSESMGDAAEIFARRLARRTYGKTGLARINQTATNTTFRCGYYDVFIGYPCGNLTAGHNVSLVVEQIDE